jgi:DNA-binding SARP family transcriptional activator
MAKHLDDIFEIEEQKQVNKTNNIVTQAQKNLQTVKQNYDMVFNPDEGMDDRFNDDFEEIRESLKDLITEIADGVQKLSLIAQDSEKASHFSALAQMSTTLLNANKQLLEIYSEKKRYHTKVKSEGAGNVNIDKAIFTGTTSDLHDWIRKHQGN